MTVRCISEKFQCAICGNEVVVVKVGGGTLNCCSQEMEINGMGEVEVRPEDSLR